MCSFAPQHCPFSITNTVINSDFLDVLPIINFTTNCGDKMRTTHSSKAALLQVTVLKLPAITNPDKIKANRAP